MEKVLSINLITSNPDVRGGRPCIAGTGIRVLDVVIVMQYHRQNPDEIAEWFGVPLAGVHAALAFYYEHKAEIDEDIRYQQEHAAVLKAQYLAHGKRSLLP
ncbi:MAG: DUF433 domain-containing protein [Aggregatilineales bacterium]